jgi:sugar/nucleoside kinase (ribokinase family)
MPTLTVVGPVFFEVFVPPADVRATPGEERYVERIPVGLGGALNAASVARALGLDVTLVHPAGEGLLDAAARWALDRMGIRSVPWPARDDPYLSLVFSDANDRGFLSHGDHEALSRCPQIPAADWVHVGGIKEAYAVPDRVAEVRANGAKVCVTGCWSPPDLDRLAAETERRWDLLVLNRKEAERVARYADMALTRLSAAATSVVITDGDRGAFGMLEGTGVRAPAEAVPVTDLTGAGDAFSAGLITALTRGLRGNDAIAFANCVASRVIGIHGGVVMDPGILAGL